MRKALFTAACLLLLTACTDPSAKLPNYGTVPHFQMTDSWGKPFDSSVLTGKVWMANLIYTSCPGPCPRTTSKVHSIAKGLTGEDDVRFVSISVDPANDTPPVLNAFAQQHGGPAANWYFLTGTPATVHLLAHEVFKVGDIIQNMDHSTKLMLVDKHGNLRGYYSSESAPGEEGGIADLIRDIELLRHQQQ